MTVFVAEQRKEMSRAEAGELMTPVERVYCPDDPAIARRLRLDGER